MPAQTMAKSKPAIAELSLDRLRQIEINFQEDIHINSYIVLLNNDIGRIGMTSITYLLHLYKIASYFSKYHG